MGAKFNFKNLLQMPGIIRCIEWVSDLQCSEIIKKVQKNGVIMLPLKQHTFEIIPFFLISEHYIIVRIISTYISKFYDSRF